MKKYLTIPVVCLILFSGMHVTVATHFCGDEIAGTKISLSGQYASCGMAHDVKSKQSEEAGFSAICCENEILVYAVDNSYTPSILHFKEISQNILHEFQVPEGFSFHLNFPVLTNPTTVSPPDNFLAGAVSLAGLCTFRI